MREPQEQQQEPEAEEPQGEGPDDAGPDDEGPRPLGVGTRPTGHGGVDAHLVRLADADHLGVPGHLEVYEDVHRGLRETLAALDQPAGPPVPGPPHTSRS
ncbi:hypothetical protein E1265_09980 [Streptomyces sp. 8K308]|uniref:hypothetical protein n=1 Tax=Streptomyces sp. 8K308 TaxID=2530388 RepID=UPI001052E829|nr:hypothetical protein [Streptomyces sp. 8K308]TDC24386.1 hypothetical protein E1265_09980 [Streptomyces sp. 8K308]